MLKHQSLSKGHDVASHVEGRGICFDTDCDVEEDPHWDCRQHTSSKY